MKMFFLHIGAWVWVVFQGVLVFWYASMARSHLGSADFNAPASMVYTTAMLAGVVAACVSVSLLVILAKQERRIRRLEQVANQLPPAQELGNQL